MNTLGISIVVPCYNVGSFLKENIQSILAQKFKYPFEIIVVDDASNNETTRRVLEEIKGNKKIRIIQLSENHGVQYARNVGIKEANFDFVFSIDADDMLSVDENILINGTYADRAIDLLLSSPDMAFVQAPWYMCGEYSGFTISSYPVTERLVLKKHHVQTSIVYRREDALRAGLYNEEIEKWQDWSFAVGLLDGRFVAGKENKIGYLKEPYYLYRIHSQTEKISHKKIDEKEMIYKTILRHPDIFKKYYPNRSYSDITASVFSNKPNRFLELMYVAKNDITVALNIIKQRGLDLMRKNEIQNIP